MMLYSAVFVHLVFYFRIKIYIRLQRVIDQLTKETEETQVFFIIKTLILSIFSWKFKMSRNVSEISKF
jgi:hypothetical protein